MGQRVGKTDHLAKDMGSCTPHGSSTRWSPCSLYPTSPGPSSPASPRSSTTPPTNASWSCSSPPSSPPAAAPSPTSSAPPPTWPRRRLQLSPRPLQASWSSLRLARILAGFILARWVPDGRSARRRRYRRRARGAKVYGKGCHRDPVRSTHSYTAFRWGHKWVVLAILVQFPFATRAWALPVLAALYRNPEKDPKAKAPKARRRKAKDRTKVQAKERARRQAEARAKAEARRPARPGPGRRGGTRRPRN